MLDRVTSVPRLDVWPPLPLGVYARRPVRELPFPLGAPGCSLFERGRQALWHGLRTLGLRPGDEVLAPAYHHGSEIEALVRAGLVCRFYEAREALEPDDGELDALLGPRTRALYLIHYLGFPQDGPRWRRWCDDRGLALLEDAAQSWLASADGRPVGSFGDIAIFCLYKTFGLPDGGALLCTPAAPRSNGSGRAGILRLAQRHAAWLMERSPPLAELGSLLERPAPYSHEEDFALGDPGRAPSAATVFLLPRVADPDAAARRRANYAVLLDEIGDLVPPPFGKLANGASPFAFPIATDDKEALLARLADRGVRGSDFWSVPHSALPADRFPRARSLRARLVAVPVHQELRTGDIERIARGVRARRAHGSQLRLEPLTSLAAMQVEWSELARRSGNIFATWEWASIWWRHFGRGRPLLAAACRAADGRLVAVLPLYLWSSRPLRVVRFLGHGTSDQLGPVCATSDLGAAARALRQLLAETHRQWDVFVGERLPGDERWSAVLGGRVLAWEGNPVLRTGGAGWDEYLSSRSANLRQQVRRRERNLERAHQLSYRLADDPTRLHEDLETLFSLHTAVREEGESRFVGADNAFHREFAACALERGWLRLWFLELDGQPRAALYGFRFGGSEVYYQSGRDPAWQASSLGFVLLAHSMRTAFEDGMRECRFGRGAEAFKSRFADVDAGLETIGLTRGPAGAAALAAATALARRGPVAALRRRFVG
jgi:dTDP-4-amino-4,6-dideoxygalactose transaminase/CelD/BcsL family acetyltransferase involved in cellulose biosynthesis